MRNLAGLNAGFTFTTLAGFVWILFGLFPIPVRADDPPGVAVRLSGLADKQVELAKRITAAPDRAMKGSGLAGVMGGIHVKMTSGDSQEVLLPIPQLSGGQVPICFFLSGTPGEAFTDVRLRRAEDGNVAAVVRLAGKKQEVKLAWSAVILLSETEVTPDRTPADPFRKPSACVQSEANEVRMLAAALWPRAGESAKFAANIQQHIRDLKPVERPRSLDALGILKSGENGICTANANLAAALMRSKGIACRTVAVVPPTSQRLEMHRIVEFFDDGKWVPFDPSSLQPDIPAKPWQNVVMANTAVKDEEAAMKPRMGATLGSPYGQEAELLTPGVMLFGEDFFWTQAKPLAAFEPTAVSARAAAKAWTRYLETGTLTATHLAAGSATTAAEFTERIKEKLPAGSPSK
jgi:hypothetical protein